MLREVASGKTRRVLARNRAITMLQYFPGKKNEALLAGILNSKCKKRDGLCLVNQQQALASYAAVKGPGSLAMIRPFLAHDNLDTRMAAAQALRLSRSPKTIPLLAERLTVEKSATVKAEIEQQIRRLEHAEKKLPQRRIPGQ